MNQGTLSATPTAKSLRSSRGAPSFISAALVLAITATVAACASTPPPTEQIAVSTAAVSHAAAAGSSVGAPAELSMARDKLRRANLAMATADYDTALRLAQQAQVDALVAEATTEAGKARKSAQEVQESSRVLREEMARKTPKAP